MEKPVKVSSFRLILKVSVIMVGLVALSTLISLLFNGWGIFQSIKIFLDYTLYGILMGLVFFLGNWVIGYMSSAKLDWINHTERANMISLLSFIFFGILASILVPYFFQKIVNNASGETLRQTVVFNSFINLSVDIVVISIYYSYYMVKHLKASIESEKNLKRENLLAKYEALKNQVNPHFLFNSLNTLTGVVEEDSKKAVDYIAKLSNTYRYVLEQRDKELIPLEDELKFVKDFIYLAKLRHGDGLIYTEKIVSKQIQVAPLGLQILIENCIKHNVIEDDRPLNIKLFQQDDYLVVENNLQKKTTIVKQERIGLENLTKRYQYLTSKPVVVEETELSFVVKLPILEGELA